MRDDRGGRLPSIEIGGSELLLSKLFTEGREFEFESGGNREFEGLVGAGGNRFPELGLDGNGDE